MEVMPFEGKVGLVINMMHCKNIEMKPILQSTNKLPSQENSDNYAAQMTAFRKQHKNQDNPISWEFTRCFLREGPLASM